MSKIIAEIKVQIKDAMKAKAAVRRDILRLVIGQIQQEGGNESDEIAIKVIKKIIKSNEETIDIMTSEKFTDAAEQAKLEEEIDTLAPYVPDAMTEDEVKAFIVEQGIDVSSAKNDGQAMGMLMKPLKSTGREIDSGVVKSVIASLRE